MKIGSYYSVYGPTVQPQMPALHAAQDLALPITASQTASKTQATKPSAAGAPLLSNNMTASLINLQEADDDTSVESRFKEMLKGSTPEEMISVISSISGFMKWQVKELTKKITAEVMGSMGITMEDLKAMPAEQKIAVMQRIMDAVQEKLQMAMEEQMKKENKSILPLFSSNIAVNII